MRIDDVKSIQFVVVTSRRLNAASRAIISEHTFERHESPFQIEASRSNSS